MYRIGYFRINGRAEVLKVCFREIPEKKIVISDKNTEFAHTFNPEKNPQTPVT